MSVGNSSFMPSLAVLEPLELLATQVKLEVPRGVFAPQIEFQELHGKKNWNDRRPIHLYTDDIDRDTKQQLINLSSGSLNAVSRCLHGLIDRQRHRSWLRGSNAAPQKCHETRYSFSRQHGEGLFKHTHTQQLKLSMLTASSKTHHQATFTLFACDAQCESHLQSLGCHLKCENRFQTFRELSLL